MTQPKTESCEHRWQAEPLAGLAHCLICGRVQLVPRELNERPAQRSDASEAEAREAVMALAFSGGPRGEELDCALDAYRDAVRASVATPSERLLAAAREAYTVNEPFIDSDGDDHKCRGCGLDVAHAHEQGCWVGELGEALGEPDDESRPVPDEAALRAALQEAIEFAEEPRDYGDPVMVCGCIGEHMAEGYAVETEACPVIAWRAALAGPVADSDG